MGFETETSSKSPSNSVFLTNSEKAPENGRQQGNENKPGHKSNGKNNPLPNLPPHSGTGQTPPSSGLENCKYCQTMEEENIKPSKVKKTTKTSRSRSTSHGSTDATSSRE